MSKNSIYYLNDNQTKKESIPENAILIGESHQVYYNQNNKKIKLNEKFYSSSIPNKLV
jgi:hypothetical protein